MPQIVEPKTSLTLIFPEKEGQYTLPTLKEGSDNDNIITIGKEFAKLINKNIRYFAKTASYDIEE